MDQLNVFLISSMRVFALVAVLACGVLDFPAAAQHQDDEQQPAPPVQRSVMRYSIWPEFGLHYSIDAACAAEVSQALGIADAEKVALLLEHAAARHDELEQAGRKRIGEAGVDEADQLFEAWYKKYLGVSPDDPEKHAEKEAAKAAFDGRVEELKKKIRLEVQQVLLEAETFLDETLEQLAALSPLEVEQARDRARLIFLRRSIMRFPPRTHFGDFQRPVDVRDFIAFAARCDEDIAVAFGVEDDGDAWAQPTDALAEIIDEYDEAQLAYLNDRLAWRRNSRFQDDEPRPRHGVSPWERAHGLNIDTIARIGTALDKRNPPMGSAWRTLFQEYFCPKLTGLRSADVMIASAIEQKDFVPAEMLEALAELAQDYELERRRLVEEAIALGIAAARAHNSSIPGRGRKPEPEQQLFLDKQAAVEALSDRTVEAVIAMFEREPALQIVRDALEVTRGSLARAGGGPWVRPHVRDHSRADYDPAPDLPGLRGD